MLATGSPALVVPGVLLAFAAGWGWPGLFNFAVVRSNPGAPAAATGVTQTGASGGAAVGPVLFGVVVEAAGYGTAWLVSGALALAALVAILAGRRRSCGDGPPGRPPLQTLAKTGNVARVKSVLRNENPFAFIAVLVMAVAALVAGVWGRVWRLEFPPQRMWDEIYFPVMASKYLRGVQFFDLHPPLGKFIIAWSIALFGDTPFAWRLMPAIFGCALIALAGAAGWYLFKERVAVLLLVLLFAGETILIVHSRTGVMDIFLVFFVMATFLVALWAREPGHALVTAVLLGLAISVKWAAFPVAIPAGTCSGGRG
jgi:hypothetical protein